jgi:hypothetical protein
MSEIIFVLVLLATDEQFLEGLSFSRDLGE